MADGHKIDCRFLFLTTGYYSYETPHKPDIPGLAGFKGRVVHPQEWTPADTAACEGKRVVVIGSGATAATLVPALAQTASHVTQLQRTAANFDIICFDIIGGPSHACLPRPPPLFARARCAVCGDPELLTAAMVAAAVPLRCISHTTSSTQPPPVGRITRLMLEVAPCR